MAPDGSDWARLAELVTRRRNELGMTQGEVQAAGGPSVASMRIIEGAIQTNYRGNLLARLERALKWHEGSVARILAGGEPSPVGDPDHTIGQVPPELREIIAALTNPIIPDRIKSDLRYGLAMTYRFWLDRHASPANPEIGQEWPVQEGR